jgi:hypothetical protein
MLCREVAAGSKVSYCHGGVYADDIALLDQQLARLVAQFAHLVLGDGPAGAQLLDRLVEVAAADAHGRGGRVCVVCLVTGALQRAPTCGVAAGHASSCSCSSRESVAAAQKMQMRRVQCVLADI